MTGIRTLLGSFFLYCIYTLCIASKIGFPNPGATGENGATGATGASGEPGLPGASGPTGATAGIDILSVLLEKDINPQFPEDVMQEVQQIPDSVTGIRKPISENGCVSFQVYSSVPMVWLYYFMPILLKIHLRNWLWSYPDGCGWNFVYFEPE